MDSDGYPTDRELEIIRNWPRTDVQGCFEFIRDRWRYPDRWTLEDDGYLHVSTGGWSGNEEMIGALRENMMIWLMSWYQITRGGHYIFKLPSVRA